MLFSGIRSLFSAAVSVVSEVVSTVAASKEKNSVGLLDQYYLRCPHWASDNQGCCIWKN
ncbi:hypothetical protein ACT432_19900 (plasmid) [Acinetobacter baumannii]